MSSSVYTTLKETAEKRIAELCEDYQAAVAQLGQCQSAVDKKKIERQIKDIEKEMDLWDGKLQKLEHSRENPDRRQQYSRWRDDLPKIDFTEALEKLEALWRQFKGKEGAFLFLMQNSHAKLGRLCLTRVEDRLKEEGADFRLYKIEFMSHHRLGETEFLDRVADHVNLEPRVDNVEGYARSVIERVCGSLQSGSIVFLEITAWDPVVLQDKFLPWFRDGFWIPIVRRLPTLANKCPLVKFVTVINVNAQVSSDYLTPSVCCTQDQFNPEKILELPLRNWQKDEIKIWLLKYSGLTSPGIGLNTENIEKMAVAIYRASGNGDPPLVRDALLEQLNKHFLPSEEE